MERKKFLNTIIGRNRWEKGRQGDKLRSLLVNKKAIFRHGSSSQQSGTSQGDEASIHKQQIHLQMKINKTLLKYEIANGNGWLRPFVAIMQKTFICLFLYASKKDTLFLQFIYTGKLSSAQRFAGVLAACFIQFFNQLEDSIVSLSSRVLPV